MRALKLFRQVYVHAEPIDFRVGRLGLAAYIQNVMGRNLFEGALFVFRNRSAKSVRIVYWDRTGIAMWEKCLEKDRFPWILAGNEQALASRRMSLGCCLMSSISPRSNRIKICIILKSKSCIGNRM
jgi:transposase